MRRFCALALFVLGLVVPLASVAEEERALKDLSPSEFLAFIREPLRKDVWGEFTGRLTCKGKGKKLNGTLRVRITFTKDSMLTQIVLNDVNVYAIEQNHKVGENTTTKIIIPEVEERPGLFEFGIEPEDLTFSFIYWDFLEELPGRTSRLRDCRVMRLKEPTGRGTVSALFDAKYGFPMEATWYREDESRPWRRMELKGAKKYENDLWFVKEMRLEGEDWKTQVKFDHAELNQIAK